MSAALGQVSFPSVADAVLALEAGVGRFLLAVQEEGVTSSAATAELDVLRRRLYALQKARARALEVVQGDGKGRPCLTVVASGRVRQQPPRPARSPAR